MAHSITNLPQCNQVVHNTTFTSSLSTVHVLTRTKASDLEAKTEPFLSWHLVPDSAVMACTPGHNQHWELLS